jgi:hypothetical protein
VDHDTTPIGVGFHSHSLVVVIDIGAHGVHLGAFFFFGGSSFPACSGVSNDIDDDDDDDGCDDAGCDDKLSLTVFCLAR